MWGLTFWCSQAFTAVELWGFVPCTQARAYFCQSESDGFLVSGTYKTSLHKNPVNYAGLRFWFELKYNGLGCRQKLVGLGWCAWTRIDRSKVLPGWGGPDYSGYNEERANKDRNYITKTQENWIVLSTEHSGDMAQIMQTLSLLEQLASLQILSITPR